MENSVIYLVLFLAASVAVVLAYIFENKIYYILEKILIIVVLSIAGVYFIYLTIKDYISERIDYYKYQKNQSDDNIHLYYTGSFEGHPPSINDYLQTEKSSEEDLG